MSKKYEQYRRADAPVPSQVLGWNMYGAGLESMGKDGRPEQFPVSAPGADQLLVRIDSVGMCFSDVKIIKQGRNHPKLYNRDLTVEPTRLGHEVSLTVIEVGENLRDRYQPGQRLAVQPDIYQQGKSTAYGYTIPGGLIQYHLIGKEVLETDAGACLLPLAGEMGYAESALLEPWGCVVASYTQRRRLEPKQGGVMWIVGQGESDVAYQFSAGLDAPATIILTDVPASVRELVAQTEATIIERNGFDVAQVAAWKEELTAGQGFDDIVLLEPRSATAVSTIADAVARRGTVNMVGTEPLDGLPASDVGRLHYDYVAFVGNDGTDIAASYGEARNRCELRAGGTAVFIGAGGPMGQMHVQRAIEHPAGPKAVVATEISDERLEAVRERFGALAEENNVALHLFNPQTADETLHDMVMRLTDGKGADDVIVSVPVAALMAEADTVMKDDGMLVLFAGVPNGTMAPLNLSNVYLSNAQYTGTSGLTIEDQAAVMQRTVEGALSPERSVAAIGGLNSAKEAMAAVMTGEYPGKIVIFPQIAELPLLGLEELPEKLPEVGAKLAAGNVWSEEAEAALFEHFWAGAGHDEG